MLFNNGSENHVKTAFYLFNHSDQEQGIQQEPLSITGQLSCWKQNKIVN